MSTTGKHRADHRHDHVSRPIVVLGCALAIAASTQAPTWGQADSSVDSDPLAGFAIPTFAAPLQLAAFPAPPALLGDQTLEATSTPSVDTPVITPRWVTATPAMHQTTAPTPAVADTPEQHPAALPSADDRLHIGHLDLQRPSVVSPAASDQISAGAGELVQIVSDTVASSGVDPARADMVGERVVGNAAIGGVLGAAAAAPVALAVGGVVGAPIGLLFGIPFLPTGLVVGPVVGTAVVASLVAAPVVAAGIVAGAATGYADGMNAPLSTTPAPAN